MQTNHFKYGSLDVVELISDEILIKTTQDALDLMGEYPTDAYIFQTKNFEADFFDLSTKKLGEILQKFANYQIKVAIVGDFDKFPSKTLKDFIYESNRFGDCLFKTSKEEVLKKWQS
jgi:hypothetical protein